MKNKVAVLIIYILFCVPGFGFAQRNNQELARLYAKTKEVFGRNEADSVKYYGEKALTLARQLNDIRVETSVSGMLGESEFKRSDYHKAVPIYLRAIKKAEKHPPFREFAKLLYDASEVYRRISRDSSANLIRRGLSIAGQLKDEELIADGYNRLGYAFELKEANDSAMWAYRKSLDLNQKIKNDIGTSYAYESLAGLYNKKNLPQQSLIFLKKSYALRLKAKDRFSQAISLINIGETYKLTKQTDSAIYYAAKALEVAADIKYMDLMQYSNNFLSDIYKERGDFKKALTYREEAFVVRDSIFNAAKSKQIEEINAKYQTEKKEQQIRTLHQANTIQKLKIRQKNTLLWAAFAVLLAGGIFTYMIINRRKLQARAKLQQEINKQQDLAAKAVLDAEEYERSRIATDLHDGVGQLLSTALMNLNNLVSSIAFQSEAEKEKADNVVTLISDSYDEMRSISHQMMPNALLKAGLSAAVRDFLNKIDQEKIGIHLEVVGFQNKLDEQVETVLYRVIQEAVNNVIRHAKASKLNIQLCNDEDGISITIEDNGKGFNMADIAQNTGIGLKNIQSRIAFLKGSVDFDSAEGKGTLVAIHIPAQD